MGSFADLLSSIFQCNLHQAPINSFCELLGNLRRNQTVSKLKNKEMLRLPTGRRPSSRPPKRLIVEIPKSRVKDEVSKLKIHPDLPSYRLSTNSTHCLKNYC